MKTKLEKMKTDEHNLNQYVINYILENYDTDEEIKTFFEDLQKSGCVSGMINNLIYYKDTNYFFDEYEDEIEDLITENMDNQGIEKRALFIAGLNGSSENITQEKNLLAWFSFEETAYKLYCELYEQ